MTSILIINLGGIGDFILSSPVIRAIHEHQADARVCLLTSSRILPVAQRLPYIDKVYCLDIKYGGWIPSAKLFKTVGVLWALRKQHFELAVNMRTLVSEKSAKKIKLLLKLINPKKSAGRNTEGRGSFFDISIPETDIGQKSEMEYDIDTAAALGIDVNNLTITLPIDKTSRKKAIASLEERGFLENRTVLIGFHIGGMPSRRWPVENFARVIDLLDKELRCTFIITGSKEDAPLAQALQSRTKSRVVDLCGALNIIETSAVIDACDLFFSNDTGPMHIAAALRTPLVAIFGPGDLKRFDPRNMSDKARVLYHKIQCAPCNHVKCPKQPELECLKTISPDDVFDAAMELWRT